MAVSIKGDSADPMVEPNVIPLVDVMLVRLIIFIITIPLMTHAVKLDLPRESNQPTVTKPENINLSIDFDGQIYWNTRRIPDIPTLVAELKKQSVKVPQPEVHIRGDENARYEAVGRVVVACQRAGIAKVGFITEPPSR